MEETQLFWDAIDQVKDNDLNPDYEINGVEIFYSLQKATELSVWLHTEFQCKIEEADSLMDKLAADETKPYEEKY